MAPMAPYYFTFLLKFEFLILAIRTLQLAPTFPALSPEFFSDTQCFSLTVPHPGLDLFQPLHTHTMTYSWSAVATFSSCLNPDYLPGLHLDITFSMNFPWSSPLKIFTSSDFPVQLVISASLLVFNVFYLMLQLLMSMFCPYNKM